MKATDITRKLVDSGQMTESKLTDPDLIRARNKASTKYPNYDKDTAMLKVLQKGVTDGEKEQKKNKKEHEKFEKDIKDAKTSNDKEHKEFKKDIKDVDKRVGKVEKDMKVNESFQCYTGAKSGKKIQILHGTHSAGVANIICRNDVFVLEIDGRHLGSFYSFEQALEQAEIEDMHFRPEEITKARAYFDQAGQTNVNESTSVDLATKALIAEIVKLIGEGHTEVSPDVITTKVSAVIGKPFMLKDLVTANNNSPALQHYIDSINPTKIKFSTDILTVKNEDPMKAKEKAQSGVANMASRAAGRDRLGENAEPATLSNLTASANQEKEQAQTQFISLAGTAKIAKEKALQAKEKFEELSQKVKALKDRLSSPTGQRVQQSQERVVNYTNSQNAQPGLAEDSNQSMNEAKGLGKKVKIVSGRDAGKSGYIRQIKHGAFKGAPKTYYIDLDDGSQANNIPASALRLVKDNTQENDALNNMFGGSADTLSKEANIREASTDHSFNYRLLSRLQTDCDYFLNHGGRSERTLWAGNVNAQIAKMKELWTALPEDGKPDWLSMEDILAYEEEMGRGDAIGEARVAKSVIDQVRSVLENGYSSIKFTDGTMKCDSYTASAVTKVFDALKPETQEKALGMMQTKAGFHKFAGFAFGNINENTNEGIVKNIKRGLSGWDKKGGIEPKEIVKRNKGYDTDTLLRLRDADASTGRVPPAHTPGNLQQRVIKKELDKRGVQEDGNEGVYSWRSTKNEDGSYNWSVIKVAYQKPVETIKSGNEPTRARAVARAKKAVMPYRRGSVTENLDDAAAEADYNTGHRRGMADAKAGKPSDSSECISKRERDGYAEGYKQLGEGISLKFNNVELNEKQVTPYTKLYFEAHNIERPHGKFINNIRSLKKRKLNESAEHAEIQPFVELIKKLDTHGKVKIGDFFAVLSFEINFAWKEIDSHGFMSPKEITDIKMNENGNINYITFSDGDRYPRLPLASFNNKPITHPAYFNDEKSAKSALTMLRLQLPDEWDLDTSGITGSTEVVDEGKRGTPGFQAFKDSQRKAGKDLSYGGIDRSKKKDKEEKKDEEEKKDKVDEGWESGPEEREPSVDRSDWDYDQARQEKLDAKVNAQPKKTTYLLVGRGPNMEPNYNFGEEFDDLEAAKAERTRLSTDPTTPNPTMIGIQTINRVVKESTTTTADILKLAGLK